METIVSLTLNRVQNSVLDIHQAKQDAQYSEQQTQINYENGK